VRNRLEVSAQNTVAPQPMAVAINNVLKKKRDTVRDTVSPRPHTTARDGRMLSTKVSVFPAELTAIIEAAGGLGNRWLLGRKAQQREESPDTVLRHGQRFVGQNS
jgi:hypothetical protein